MPLSLSSSVTSVREYSVPSVDNVHHISSGGSGILWVSNGLGDLVKTDIQDNQLQKIQTQMRLEGFHAVTQDGDPDGSITPFIVTGDWEPICIYSSQNNGDILVGMMKGEEEAKVIKYNKSGTVLKNIQIDSKGKALYSGPHFITENNNGDVLMSDLKQKAVVIVDRLGQNSFSYKDMDSNFIPYGICTDVLGNIIVCDFTGNTVRRLTQDGYSLLLTSEHGVEFPRTVCVDHENNLCVGQWTSGIVKVYKYLQN